MGRSLVLFVEVTILNTSRITEVSYIIKIKCRITKIFSQVEKRLIRYQ